MIEETPMSEAESLQLISSMINKAKNRFSENGFLYLLWGWVILACCVIQYLGMYVFHFRDAYVIWFLPWLVLIFQVIYLRKKKAKSGVRTYADGLAGFVWLAFMISFFIMLFVLIQFEEQQMIYPMLLILYGIPTFLCGAILQFRPLLFGGMFCWALAVVSPFVPLSYALLLVSLALIGAWIIPGYYLRARFKKSNK